MSGISWWRMIRKIIKTSNFSLLKLGRLRPRFLSVIKTFANDLEEFILIQKIMELMVIGVALLAAAYKFQRYCVAQEKS